MNNIPSPADIFALPAPFAMCGGSLGELQTSMKARQPEESTRCFAT